MTLESKSHRLMAHRDAQAWFRSLSVRDRGLVIEAAYKSAGAAHGDPLAHLRAGGTLTTREARALYGVNRLPSRIYKWRKKGMVFDVTRQKTTTGVEAVYSLGQRSG